MKLKLNLNRAHEKLKSKRVNKNLGHILLVDDEPENLDGLEALLSNEGYQVTATTSPEEAISVVQRESVDLVISDQRMPVMLGTEMLEAIREQRADNIRVILTGQTDMNDLIHCINHGLLYRYLVKPWNAQEVLSVVSEGMKKIRIERSTQRLIPSALWSKLYADRLEETTPGEGRHIQCSAVVVSVCNLPMFESEHNPSAPFALLSRVMGALRPLAEEHNGYLSHTLGERAVIIFERPQESASDAIRCMRALPKLATELNQALHQAPNQTPNQPDETSGAMTRDLISLSAGAHTGEALLGMIGDQRRLSLTMIGGAVEVALALDDLAVSLYETSQSGMGLISAQLHERLRAEVEEASESMSLTELTELTGLTEKPESTLTRSLRDSTPIYQVLRGAEC